LRCQGKGFRGTIFGQKYINIDIEINTRTIEIIESKERK
jgi:hypothetical protein